MYFVNTRESVLGQSTTCQVVYVHARNGNCERTKIGSFPQESLGTRFIIAHAQWVYIFTVESGSKKKKNRPRRLLEVLNQLLIAVYPRPAEKEFRSEQNHNSSLGLVNDNGTWKGQTVDKGRSPSV